MSKDLYSCLESGGLLDYGSVIPGDLVREILGLVLPEYGTKAQFDAVSLKELSAIDYVRSQLLGQGKYLAGFLGNYRILLPSENAEQVKAYMRHTDHKLLRAQKLAKSTPAEHVKADQTLARIVMKRESASDRPSFLRH